MTKTVTRIAALLIVLFILAYRPDIHGASPVVLGFTAIALLAFIEAQSSVESNSWSSCGQWLAQLFSPSILITYGLLNILLAAVPELPRNQWNVPTVIRPPVLGNLPGTNQPTVPNSPLPGNNARRPFGQPAPAAPVGAAPAQAQPSSAPTLPRPPSAVAPAGNNQPKQSSVKPFGQIPGSASKVQGSEEKN